MYGYNNVPMTRTYSQIYLNNSSENNNIKIYFILDYPLGTERKECKDNYNFNGVNSLKIIDSGTLIKNEENKCEYDVFCVSLQSSSYKQELQINYYIDNKFNNIVLKIPRKNNYIFVFDDIIVKNDKLKYIPILYYFKERKFSSFISEIDKLIIFKRALKKNNEEKIYSQLIEEGLLLFNKNKNFYFLLNLFCMSQGQTKSKKIINMFYKSIKIGEKSLLHSEEILFIKNHMEKVEGNISFYIDFNACPKEIFYAFFIYYKILFCPNDINNYIDKLYNNNELKIVLLNILREYNEYLSKKLSLTPKIIKDLVLNSLNDFESFSNSLKYIKDILLYLEIITNNIDKIYKNFYFNNKVLYITEDIIKLNKYEIEKICLYINKIIEYQKKNKAKFVFFNSSFWINYINDLEFKKPNLKNIHSLFFLRDCIYQILNLDLLFYDDNQYNYRLFLEKNLHIFIKKIVKNETEEKISNNEKIDLLLNKDPYYFEEKYKNKSERDPDIFNYIEIFEINNQIIYNKIDNLFIYNNVNGETFINILFEQIDELNKLKKLFTIIDLNKKNKDIFNYFIYKINEKLQILILNKKINIKNDFSLLLEIILLIIDLIIKNQINILDNFILNIDQYKLEKQFKEEIFFKIFEKYKDFKEIKQNINNLLTNVIKEKNKSAYSLEMFINCLKLLDLNDLKNFFINLRLFVNKFCK